MRIVSVIHRELRVQARQPFTYWLRAVGLLVLLAGGTLFLEDELFEANLGGRLFGAMHFLCYLALWILLPLAAADCISRERREGTLGLLFLTPLRPSHIVIAKSVAHGLRAVSLVFALVPAFTIPFLLGGVPWQQAVMSLIVNCNVLCWGIAAALAASVLSRTANRSLSLAVIFAAAGFLFFPWSVGAILGMGSFTTWSGGYSQGAYDFFSGFAVVGTPRLDYAFLSRFITPAQLATALGMASVISLAVLVFSVMFAANRIRNSWRDLPPSARRERIERAFCEPRFGRSLLRKWMRFKLDRNPLGWLEQRHWSGRIVTWAWFAVIISVYSMVLTDRNFFRGFGGVNDVIAWALAFSIAATAVGSFRRERETGVLELLLVTPLQTRTIISGRLIGLWAQFAPAAVIFLLLWTYLSNVMRGLLYAGPFAGGVRIWFFAVSFLVLPLVGLYFSLRCRHYLTAFALTLFVTFIAPALIVVTVRLLWSFVTRQGFGLDWSEHLSSTAWIFQIAFALGLGWALRKRLDARAFPLQQSLQ